MDTSSLSDCDSFSESSSYDDQDYVEYLYGGHACSILSSLEESIGKIDDFLSFERVFMYGDIVCPVNDPSGQMGKVINVEMIVDLENIHGRKIRDVNSKDLVKIRPISVGDYVVMGPWLGKVEKIVDKVTVLFDDGAKSEFAAEGSEMLTPISSDLVEDPQYPFYPGQRVQVQSVSASGSANWLCGVRSGKREQGTIYSLEAGIVHVDWIGYGSLGCEKVPSPPNLQDSEKLTLLSCFSHAKWQLGDCCVLPVADSKNMLRQSVQSSPPCGAMKEDRLNKASQKSNRSSAVPQVAVISKTRTKVDVLWQDGSVTIGLDSDSVFPVNIVDAHEFWPEQFVLEKGMCDDSSVPSPKRWGVVRCVDAKERTVKVKWTTFSLNEPNKFRVEQTEEIVSAYELMDHPDYSYCLGDAVCKFCEDQVFSLDGKSMFSEIGMDINSKLKNIDTRKDNSDFLGYDHSSCIGIIVSFKDGNIEVKWATGFTSMVAPFEIYRIDKCETAAAITVPSGESAEQSGAETSSNENQLSKPEEKDLLKFGGDRESCNKSLWDSSSCLLSQAAIGFFSSITSSLFGPLSSSLFGTYQAISEEGKQSRLPNEEEIIELSNLNAGIPTLGVGDVKASSERELEQEQKTTEDQKDDVLSSSSKLPEEFRQFDMVTGFSDHHFADGAGKAQLSQVKRGWLKKVHQEWSILEHDLPETIYVRVCEERMDLLRAAIIGAPGTPYHDGVFFFDIYLPSEYPHEPPMVYYHSGGLRVNPNLYESGKVCLSLLNTWTGSGNELWNPKSSTILQVLLSLQALVLNEKPYFNEAGYDAQIGKADGEKNSVSYNENAFLVTCKSMLYQLNKPPKHFEALVQEHFGKRWKHILLACKAYMDGAPVGSAFQPKSQDQEPIKGSSTGFKIMLGKLFPKLAEAFADKGIDCSQLSD
ncbi:probable ubiquitin-conjugating enzyme E2 24 [Nicotiana tomentosiformis]|uniref:probable ubiquitin-conjugating enzyme E2 24 n=1 Tax=Nicotiana tomentosiformis TaxID=4098 RepID=UPI00051C2D79|nr:probable ubiquitin-conjugating enzyme E2 24 [Nicotiana tomentosiformis]XP_009605287.1 probable ubiquitin-conjugating enzyme E2 24 [Nicotiana tomentosiformis]XP_009605288.1 probable ubiquitin-conjugating enzyme E2 24 [Nicotiana tomentosiformis]